MSDTKYIMRDGRFVIFSKYLGVEHAAMARMVWPNGGLISAGFAYHGYGEFNLGGVSISLGVRSKVEDEGIVTRAFEAGEMVLCDVDSRYFSGWVATNDPTLFPDSHKRPATETLLHDLKIFP